MNSLLSLAALGGFGWWLWKHEQPPARNPQRHDPVRERNPDFFTDGHGIHPIRESSGYDPIVEEQTAEQREDAERAERMSVHKPDARAVAVSRPPWAAGITNAELVKIAHKYDVSPNREGWWEEAGLIGSSRTVSGRKLKGSGELRYELEAGQHRSKGRLEGHHGAARPGAPKRRLSAAESRMARGDYSDIPF